MGRQPSYHGGVILLNPPVEVQPRRVSPTKGGRFVCKGEDVTDQYADRPVITANNNESQLWVDGIRSLSNHSLFWKTQGNLVRVNMFRRKAGFKVIKNGKPIKTQPDYIISVETGGKHYYALSEVSMEWAKLASFPSKKSEPRLRLETRGILVKSAGKGRVSIRGKMHPLFDKIKIIPKERQNPEWGQTGGIEQAIGRRLEKFPRPSKASSWAFEIGSERGPHGHLFDGGISISRGSERERLLVYWGNDRDGRPLDPGLHKIYNDFLAYKQSGRSILSSLRKALDPYPRSLETWHPDIPGNLVESKAGLYWTIGDLTKIGGVCRHFGVVAGAILERAMREGNLSHNWKVYYARGPGHGWAVLHSLKDNKIYVFDHMQKRYDSQENLDFPKDERVSAENQPGHFTGKKTYFDGYPGRASYFDGIRNSVPDLAQYLTTRRSSLPFKKNPKKEGRKERPYRKRKWQPETDDFPEKRKRSKKKIKPSIAQPSFGNLSQSMRKPELFAIVKDRILTGARGGWTRPNALRFVQRVANIHNEPIAVWWVPSVIDPGKSMKSLGEVVALGSTHYGPLDVLEGRARPRRGATLSRSSPSPERRNTSSQSSNPRPRSNSTWARISGASP